MKFIGNILFIVAIYGVACVSLQHTSNGDTSSTSQRISDILAENAQFAFTDDMGWQADLLEAMMQVYGRPSLESEVEGIMIQFLNSEASYAAKKAVWREFANIVSERSLPVLMKLLQEDETRVLALLILQKANLSDHRLLTDAFENLSPLSQASILNHFGDDGKDDAIPLLEALSRSAHPPLAEAAMISLGKLGTAASAESLLEAFSGLESIENLRLFEALLECAEKLASSNERSKAYDVYQGILSKNPPVSIRTAAIRGLFTLSNDPIAFINERLLSSPPELMPDIIRLTRELPSTLPLGDLILMTDRLDLQNRIQLMHILVDRGDSSIRPFALNLLEEGSPGFRSSGLSLLEKVGTAEDIPILIQLAVQADKQEREKILRTLALMRRPDVDTAILTQIHKENADEIPVLLELIQIRGTEQSIPAVVRWIEHPQRTIQREAIRALGVLGTTDHLESALEALTRSSIGSIRRAWERTVYQLALKQTDMQAQFTAIERRIPQEKHAPNLVSFLSILGQAKEPNHLTILTNYLNHPDHEVQTATIRGLSEWQTSEPTMTLAEKFRTSTDKAMRLVALRATLQVMEADRRIASTAKLDLLDNLREETRDPKEWAEVIGGYGEVDTIRSLETLVTLLKEHANRSEIETSIRSITRNIYEDNKDASIPWILKAKRLSSNDTFRSWIDDGLRKERFDR